MPRLRLPEGPKVIGLINFDWLVYARAKWVPELSWDPITAKWKNRSKVLYDSNLIILCSRNFEESKVLFIWINGNRQTCRWNYWEILSVEVLAFIALVTMRCQRVEVHVSNILLFMGHQETPRPDVIFVIDCGRGIAAHRLLLAEWFNIQTISNCVGSVELH